MTSDSGVARGDRPGEGEYDAVVKQEESRVREAGGLHVIGTNGMSPAVSITSCGAVPAAGRPRFHPLFPLPRRQPAEDFRGDRVAGLMNAFRVEEDMPTNPAC